VTVDADIQGLKVGLASVTNSVDKMSAKLDTIMAVQIEVAKLQSEQRQLTSSLERAFSAIGDNRLRITTLEDKVTRSFGFVRGAMFFGAILFAFIQWYAIDQVTELRAVGPQLTAMDRRILLVEQLTGRFITTPEGNK